MYNLFFKILILIVILSTLCIIGLKPKMHSKVMIYDSSYTVVENIPQTTVETKLPEIKQTVSMEKKIANNTKKEVQKITTTPKQIPIQKKVSNQPQKEIITQQKPKIEVAVKKENKVEKKVEPKKIEVKKEVEPKKEEKKVQEPIKVQTQTLSEREEEIAWNIWRSNIQNQIMRDVKLPYIPKGTVFKFSFDVDKYGRITNVKTWSLNANYTPHAIQYIAPVIRSYQGKNILDFPQGTQRLSTTVKGGWRISDNAVYSTPNDYNDIEKVKK